MIDVCYVELFNSCMCFGVFAYRTLVLVLACVVFAYCMFMHSCVGWALSDGRYYPCGNIG